MKLAMIGRLAGAMALTIGLAGCVDMTQELTVTSETTAEATVTMTMGADIYAMIKSAGDDADNGFCNKDDDELTENADGSATCVSTSEGTFDELAFEDGDSKPVFTSAGPGLVRVAIPTKDMANDVGKDSDAESMEMLKQMFEGHFITLRINGNHIADTNMTLSDDETSAETRISFSDLLNGKAKLPAELYAVVDTN